MQEKQVNNPFKDLNGWAMEAGCVLGAYGCASLALFKWSLLYPVAGSLFTFSLAGGPVVAGLLTRRMRDRSRPADAPFLFTEGFLHTLLMGLYASLWVALFIFLYLHYFDGGTLFSLYAQLLQEPEMQRYLAESGMAAQIKEITDGGGVEQLAEALQRIGAATYASLSLYAAFVVSPAVALVAGALLRRTGRSL